MMPFPRLRKKRFLLLGGSCAVLAATAVIFWQARRSAEAAPTAEKTYIKGIGPREKAAAVAAREVRKQPVEAVQRNLTLRLTGSLSADEKSEVGSNAAGNVSETRVERGSFVKKGDVLVQIDPRDAQNALEEGMNIVEELRVRLGLDESQEFRVDEVPEVEAAKLAMDMAERTFRRSEALKKQNAVALESYDQADTEYHSAVHRYHLARRMAKQLYRNYRSAVTHLVTLRKAVDDCTIRAPMEGWVAERNISVGERIIAMFPGAKLVTLLRIDPLRLALTVPQQEMAQIKPGQTVTFQTDAFPGRQFTGTVRVHQSPGGHRQPLDVRRGRGAQSEGRAAAGVVRHGGAAVEQETNGDLRARLGGVQSRRRGRRVRCPRRHAPRADRVAGRPRGDAGPRAHRVGGGRRRGYGPRRTARRRPHNVELPNPKSQANLKFQTNSQSDIAMTRTVLSL